MQKKILVLSMGILLSAQLNAEAIDIETLGEKVFGVSGLDQKVFGVNGLDQKVFGENGLDQKVFGENGLDQKVFGENGLDQKVFGENGLLERAEILETSFNSLIENGLTTENGEFVADNGAKRASLNNGGIAVITHNNDPTNPLTYSFLTTNGLDTSGTIKAGGLASLNGGLTVTGETILNGATTLNGDTTLDGKLTSIGTQPERKLEVADGVLTTTGPKGGTVVVKGNNVTASNEDGSEVTKLDSKGLTITGENEGDTEITKLDSKGLTTNGKINTVDLSASGHTELNTLEVKGDATLNNVNLKGALNSQSTSGPNRNIELSEGVLTTTGPNGGSIVVKGNNLTASDATGDKTTRVDSNGVKTTGAVSGSSLHASDEYGTTDIRGGSLVIQTNDDGEGPKKVFSIQSNPASLSRMGTFGALPPEDIFSIDDDGNLDTIGTISAQAMVVNGVDVGSTLHKLNRRLDNVEKVSYRGIAIALAAQQQVPSIKPGQFALFGGVGYYESEAAGALGVVGAFNERTSVSAALGIASGNEVGGRVGVSYVFGGN